MATDDREEQFERALAKHLKGAAEHACPDTEVLSAYHERTLSLEEMAKWKEHIAGCERCQETLALVEQTESVDAEAWQEQNAALPMEGLAAKAEMVRTAAARMRLVAGSMVTGAAPAAPVELPRRGSRAQWKWIVPIGAVAAGVMVWVGVAEIKHKQEADQAAQIAQNTPPAAPQTALELKTPPPAAVQPNAARDSTAQSRDDSKAWSAASPPSAAPNASASPRMIAPRAVQELKQELDKKKDAVGEGHGYGNGTGAKAPAAAPSAERTDDVARNRGDVTALAKESGVVAGAAANAPVSRVTPAPMPPADKGRATAANRSEAAPFKVSTITGTVLDPSGAAIGGALITAIDTSSGNSRTAVADAAGRFVLADLPSDQYRVVVAHAGFVQSEQTLTLEPQQNEQLQVHLKLGSVTQSVEVSAGASPTLNSETAELSTNAIPGEKVGQLPGNGRNFQQLAQLAASDPRYIMAPDQKLAWRVGDAGKIERSTDHGKTWKLQKSGVAADLRAGSAISDRACWVIGKAGTILLTTDGGKHWRQVTSPIADDIGGIHATDAQHATIWSIPNRKSFQTSDGGATWTPAANE